VNEPAVAGVDFMPTTGTLRWEDGDAADKDIYVPIINDNILKSSRAFRVELSTASGASIGSQAWEDVAIWDDDTPSPPAWSGQFRRLFIIT
jgi:hypothetical protein